MLSMKWVKSSVFLMGFLGTFWGYGSINKDPTPKTSKKGIFFQIQPFFWNPMLGVFLNHHRIGLFTDAGITAFEQSPLFWTVGTEYAYHLNHVDQSGFYGKAYLEHRHYHPDLLVGNGSSTVDTLNHHIETHCGMLVGYQWRLLTHAYIQAGWGLQHNDNPVKRLVFSDSLFPRNDIRKQWSNTGELAFGYFLSHTR